MSMVLKVIGVIRSPYKRPEDAPRQGRLSDEISCLEISGEFRPGMDGLGRHACLIVLYWLDRADRALLTATPPGETEGRGVFATRSQNRPNPIGIAVVDLVRIEGGTVMVKGLDAIDGTPLLDIKPYSAAIDSLP